jgi:hypothetical protein
MKAVPYADACGKVLAGCGDGCSMQITLTRVVRRINSFL